MTKRQDSWPGLGDQCWGQDVGTRLGAGLGHGHGQARPGHGHGQAMANIWPRWPKFGLEKNFCSVVWKPILSDQAESEGSMAKNEGVG